MIKNKAKIDDTRNYFKEKGDKYYFNRSAGIPPIEMIRIQENPNGNWIPTGGIIEGYLLIPTSPENNKLFELWFGIRVVGGKDRAYHKVYNRKTDANDQCDELNAAILACYNLMKLTNADELEFNRD